jgi:ParB family transcriptional regulator, chromosome partitioning protein
MKGSKLEYTQLLTKLSNNTYYKGVYSMIECVLNKRDLTKEDLKNIIYIDLDVIRPNPCQPRKQFRKESLEELCNSIKEYGVLQPVNVRKISKISYELVAGERRLRAAKMAGLRKIPAILVDVKDDDSAILALIENLQREDLSYMEEAEGYANLLNDYHFTQEQLASKLGKSQSTIANKIRLLKLSKEVKKVLADNHLSERHARALLKVHDEKMQLKVLDYVCHKGLNVKKTEELIEKIIQKYPQNLENKKQTGSFTKAIKDVRIFVNSIRQAIELMKKSGVNAKAAQLDKGVYTEFIVRIPKEAN